jgi:hydrogenase maturation protease
MKLLIFGYGNPGRSDDGLGNEFVNEIRKYAGQFDKIEFGFDSNYQLNIEDAERIKDFDLVLFADASTEEIEDFCFSKVDGSGKPAFTTHSANPEYIFGLCRQLFGKEPLTFLLHIRGYVWELDESLTEKAKLNLMRAVDFFLDALKKNDSPDEISKSLLSRKCLK